MILHPSPDGARVSLADLRKALGDHPRGGILAALVRAGVIEADRKGRVSLAQAVPCYFSRLRADLRAASASAGADRARAARAGAAELRLSEARRDLVARDDALTATDALTGEIVSTFASLPARITRDMGNRRHVAALTRAAQAALAKELSA